MPPKIVREDEMGFTLDDGSSPFRVPKKDLSPKMVARIRAMPTVEVTPGQPVITDRDAGNVTFGEPVPAAPELNRLPEDPGLAAQRNEEVRYGVPGYSGAGGGTQFTPTPEDPGYAAPVNLAAEFGRRRDAERARSRDPIMDAITGGAPQRANEGFGLGEQGKAIGIKPRSGGVESDHVAAPPPVAAPPVAPRGPGNLQPGARDVASGFEMRKRGAEDLADVAAAQGNLEAVRLGAQQRQMEIQAIEDQDFHARAAARSAEQLSKWESASNEMKNISTTVDPGRFWASRDTGGKIAGIVGLVLGAFGTGPDGINKAAVMLNNAVDRDIDAQKSEFAARMAKGKQSVDAASSMYAMNRQIFGDELAARAASKASALGLAENEVMKNLAAAKAPEAQAKLQMLLGDIQQKKGEAANEAKAAANTAALQWAALGAKQAGATGPAQKAQEALTEIESRNQTIHNSGTALMGLIDRYGTGEGGLGAPGIEARMKQLANDMAIDAAKLKDPGSVARPGEVELELQNLFEPGWMQRADSAKAKIQSFLNNAEARRATAYSVRGIQPTQGRK